ncbi:unnamed protein product [Schistosoma rodhaini]|nr:unnamed protein product [Schistosoma rodhaini]
MHLMTNVSSFVLNRLIRYLRVIIVSIERKRQFQNILKEWYLVETLKYITLFGYTTEEDVQDDSKYVLYCFKCNNENFHSTYMLCRNYSITIN